MTDLATTYLRQARGFLRAGDPYRAVDLLERARVLARGDRDLLRGILEELSGTYSAVGQADRAARCHGQLAALGPSPEPAPGQAQPPGAYAPFAGGPPAARVPSPAGRRERTATILVLPAAVLAVGFAIVAIVYWRFSRTAAPAPSAATVASATEPAPPTPAASPIAAGRTSAAPAAAPVAARAPGVPAPRIGAPPDQLMLDDIGLVVVMAHYEGTVSGQHVSIDVPVGNGTAFAIDSGGSGGPGGLMLTCRHVVKAEKGDDAPPTLEEVGMPTVTRRRTDFLVCFGPDSKDHYKATIVRASDQFDVALLKVDRHFSNPLSFATAPSRQGDDVFVCGYPGAVIEMLNGAAKSPERRQEFVSKARSTGTFDFLLESFSPDSFSSTLTRGIVSAAERNIDGAAYLQTDAAVNPGNSGGPVLNSRQQVVGIVTLKIGPAGVFDKYNFALLPEQFKDEFEQYLKAR